jgi:uncharacterized damage-inducible protein DinB
MTETVAEYSARILGYLGDKDPLETLASTPGRLAALLADVDTARITLEPAPGRWSIQEILAHLADAELVMGYRVRRVLEATGVAIDAYDQNRWAAAGRYDRVPHTESLPRIQADRAGNVRLLRSLRPEQMEQYGVHSERGKETIAYMSRMWAGHDLNHRRQILTILAS